MLSRVDASEVDIHVTYVEDLAACVQGVLNTLNVLAEEKQQNITMHADGKVPANTDVELLKLGLMNIIHNAIHYTQTGGDISIHITTQSNPPSITISDNGSGITPEVSPFIFDRFYRGIYSTMKQVQG